MKKIAMLTLLTGAVLSGCLSEEDELNLDPMEAPEWGPGRVHVYDVEAEGEVHMEFSMDGESESFSEAVGLDGQVIEEVLATEYGPHEEPSYLVATDTDVRVIEGPVETSSRVLSAVRMSDLTAAHVSLMDTPCGPSCSLEDVLHADPFGEWPLFDFPLSLGDTWTASVDPVEAIGPPYEGLTLLVEAEVVKTDRLDHPVVGETETMEIAYTSSLQGVEGAREQVREEVESTGLKLIRHKLEYATDHRVTYGLQPSVVLSIEYTDLRLVEEVVVATPDGETMQMSTKLVMPMQVGLVELRQEEAPQRGPEYVRALMQEWLPVGVSATTAEPPALQIVPDQEEVVANQGTASFRVEVDTNGISPIQPVEWTVVDAKGEETTSSILELQDPFTHSFDSSGVHRLQAVLVEENGETSFGTHLLVPVHLDTTVGYSCPTVTGEALASGCATLTVPVKYGAQELDFDAHLDGAVPSSATFIVTDPQGSIVHERPVGEGYEGPVDPEQTGDWVLEVVHDYGVLEEVEFDVRVVYAAPENATGPEDLPGVYSAPALTLPDVGWEMQRPHLDLERILQATL